MPDPSHTCGTCVYFTPGLRGIVGECRPEMEGTTADKVCPIGLWRPREEGPPAVDGNP